MPKQQPVENCVSSSPATLENLIAEVERLVFGGAAPKCLFIAAPPGRRFVRMGAGRKARKTKWRPGGSNPDLSLYPQGLREHAKWLKSLAFHRMMLTSQADLMVSRSNLSLFYFSRGMRIKIHGGDRQRPVAAFVQEYRHRRKMGRQNSLKVPRLIQGHVHQPPYFMVDEIVAGDIVAWRHPGAEETFKAVIPALWAYYQDWGIQWLHPGELGLDLPALLSDYRRLVTQKPDVSFPFRLSFIEKLSQKTAPCSYIHGDFAIHNIIIAKNNHYLMDWELSAFDFLMRDFYRLLIIQGWDLASFIEGLFQRQSVLAGGASQNAMTFCEQLYLVLFLEIHGMLRDASCPARLLKRAENEMAVFFQSARANPATPFHCFAHE